MRRVLLDETAPYDVAVRDEPFAWHPGRTLQVRIFEPEDGGRTGRPLVVDVHGGAWAATDRTADELYCRAVAAGGAVVLAPDFRDGRTSRHPAASADVVACLRWARLNAARLGVDPERAAYTGSSSGGHLALFASLRPNEEEHANTRLVMEDGTQRTAGDVDASVRFVAALWPPCDPLERYKYVQRMTGKPVPEGQTFRPGVLVANTAAYFGSEEVMAAASIAAVVGRGEHSHLPPIWVAHPEHDLNVPRSITENLLACYRHAGGDAEATLYPGEVHAFGLRPGPSVDGFLRDLRSRLATHLNA